MYWKTFVKKWQLSQTKKPATQIISNRQQFVFATVFCVNMAVDPISEGWTNNWNETSRQAILAKMDEFVSDYNSLQDFVIKN